MEDHQAGDGAASIAARPASSSSIYDQIQAQARAQELEDVDKAIAASLAPDSAQPINPGIRYDDGTSPSNPFVPYRRRGYSNAIGAQTYARRPNLPFLGPRDTGVEEDMTMALCHLNFHDADTLVLIDTPPKQPEQSDCEYKLYERRCKDPHRVHSSKLRALNSNFFDPGLRPTACDTAF